MAGACEELDEAGALEEQGAIEELDEAGALEELGAIEELAEASLEEAALEEEFPPQDASSIAAETMSNNDWDFFMLTTPLLA